MRLRILALSLLLVTLPPVSATHGDVRISEVLPDPDGAREFVELWNAGDAGVDLAGWTVSDTAGNVYTFGNHTLPPGGRIVVWGGGEADARGPAWSKASVWNNGGDQVLLHDASGTLVDGMSYGSAEPAHGNGTVPTAPATGKSLHLADGWIEATPTPGSAPPTAGAGFTATVANVAPDVALSAPAEAAPGATIEVVVSIHDANGDADLAAWHLHGDGVALANGTTAGDHAVSLAAPSDRDTWILRVAATDHAGAVTEAEHLVAIQVGGIAIIMPAGGVGFPAFPPGAAEVLADANFTLRNTAEQDIAPRIDVSDLTGAGTIPVTGRLDIGMNGQWTTYDGPLTQLPSIPAGQSVDVQLRLRDLPSPLPAGSYGTSFTVIA